MLAIRSSDMRAELLGMGYEQSAVSEQTVRSVIRALIARARHRE